MARFTRSALILWIVCFLAAGCAHPTVPPVTVTLLPTPTTPAQPDIHVDPQESLFDQIVSIRLTGFAPNQQVLVLAEALPGGFFDGVSQAIFLTDAKGEVDLAKQAPVSGSYTSADVTGLFWSIKPVPGASTPTAAPTPSVKSASPFPFKGSYRLTASVNGQVVAQATIVKTIGTAGMTVSDVRANGLYGTLFMPSGTGPFPAVITLGGSTCGLETGYISMMLATHGYASLALAYCDRFGSLPGSQLPNRIRRIPLEYFGKVIEWLQKQPNVDSNRVAVWGDSRGAEAALLVGVTYPQIKAVIAIAGYTIPQAGDSDSSSEKASSWSYQGKDIPFLANNFPEYQAVHPFMLAVNSGKDAASLLPGLVAQMNASPDLTSVAIPVERINGPVLFITGLDDRLVYSSLYAEFAVDRLKTHQFAFPYLHLMAAGAGHLIGAYPYLLQQDKKLQWRTHEWLGGTAQADAAADEVSWPKVLEYLGMMK